MHHFSKERLKSFQESQMAFLDVVRPHEELQNGITTRTLALKLRERDEKELSNIKLRSGTSITSRSTSSRFLAGTAVPNSVVRSESNQLQTLQEIEDKDAARAKRDQFVQDLVNKVKPRMYNIVYKEQEVLEKYEESIGTSPAAKLNIDEFNIIPEDDEEDLDETERKLRQSLRIARRTSALLPIDYDSRPTLESIRKAIENTPTITDIIDIDSLNMRNKDVKEVEEKKSSPRSSMVSVASNVHSSVASAQSKASKTTSGSKKKVTRPPSGSQKTPRHSILKDSTKPTNKTHRSVSIIETKIETKQMEDSETQTYLKMMNLKPR